MARCMNLKSEVPFADDTQESLALGEFKFHLKLTESLHVTCVVKASQNGYLVKVDNYRNLNHV